MKTKIILDIGCGKNKTEGAIGIDKLPLKGVDIVYDITKIPYPLKSEFVDIIICKNILEHIRDIIPVMEEFHRLLKPKGLLIVNSPHGKTLRYLGDPTHERPITCSTMNYFLPDYPYNYYTKARFKIVKIDLEKIPPKAGIFYNFYRFIWNYVITYLWEKRVWPMEKILCFLGFNFSIEFKLEKVLANMDNKSKVNV